MSIKLSDAIRLGSMLGPQCFKTSISGNASCALGAAALATGYKPCIEVSAYEHIQDVFGIVRCLKDGTPVCISDVFHRIVDLNDDARLTRERIADWLETSGNDMESLEVSSLAVKALEEKKEAVCQ